MIQSDGILQNNASLLQLSLEKRLLRAANDHIRLDANAQQFLDAVLSGLRFLFAGGLNIRNQRYMNIHAVFPADIRADLTDGIQKRQTFNVADRSADFRDDKIGIDGLRNPENAILDFVGHMRYDLDGCSQIIAPSFFGDNGVINFACCNIGIDRQILIDENARNGQDPNRFPRRRR